ncbi:phosphoadenosine phosphosulfate reductase domain-containing protein [Acidicapsa ligni]|uniref:phosphoadenosine phosphosulfate reductase domain-containing protein n=1 Tax=Acidicapsa ligni TaxID=542300 RepID=UPI0021E0E25D|nr:phosphoadenosine phosphosulfate reductase family protein [Acidicapsa ligni]
MSQWLGEVRRLAQEHGNDLALVVNHSGGKDSTRMLGYIRKKFPDVATYAVMADTGFEHLCPISAADFARSRCAEFGLDLTVVRNPKRTYLEMVEQRGMFPSPQYRQCTSDLKRGPIDKFIRRLAHKVIVNCIGIRSEESNPRSRLLPLTLNNALCSRHRTVYSWLPIFEQTLPDVLAWHWVNAIRLHPMYVPEFHKDGTTGGYLRRLSCRVCIFSTNADLVAIQQHDPAAFEAIASLEQKLKFTMRPGASLVEIVESHSSVRREQARQQSFCF